MPTRFQFKIEETVRKNRLDNFLCDEITVVSKIYLRNLLKREVCTVNGTIKGGGYHLQKDDLVELEVDVSAETAMKPECIPLQIVFEDEEIIVVNKPAGLLVHPTSSQKTGTLLNALAYYLNQENVNLNNSNKLIRPGLVHRLDRLTSGLVVAAKTTRAHKLLSNHFERRLVKKKYLAVVEGVLKNDSGTIDAPIGRVEQTTQWNVTTDGKSAITHYKVLEKFSDKTLLELEPVTGRTNQLRIHCAYLGHPIIGDPAYNGREFSRLCLHAAQLGFFHPAYNSWVEFQSETPPEMK
ncbi:MAG: RluA family pseudouridine synthase [Acidobacteriota bacterium]|nr:RluA family pseudouridine synthase [Acidobacteriota bacterium]MDQ3374799.1 RluA family pseudouridine synthase [Acidobacteriota bacterium]